MKIEFIDGYTVLDGIKTMIPADYYKAMQPGVERIRKVKRIGEAVLANIDKYPEFRDI